ncbi:formin-binding protein 1 [Trichinella spiralis]|uniref:formin-binding protein 1 n=1 Tax=Trichinella spiralis TaxID=6334 RepID=UPI0001EFD871|nr:formin-binding protein 1 [Trichinella spiralis]
MQTFKLGFPCTRLKAPKGALNQFLLVQNHWDFYVMDQTNSISAHTLKGIEFLERYAAFIKDRCSVELQYASSLRLLLYYKPVGECRSYSQLATGISQTLTLDVGLRTV